MIQQRNGEVVYFSYRLFDPCERVTNILSSRCGGVSVGSYTSLNMGLHVGDDADLVLRNRELLCRAVGVESRALTTGQQVHGLSLSIVTEADRGKGSIRWEDGLPRTDGLITNVPDLPLLVLVADCAALSFYDPKQKVIAMSHAGWRGIVGKIGQKTVATMSDNFGCDPRDVLVGIGPSIAPCCYEVRDDVLQPFREAFDEPIIVHQPDGSAHLNLWSAARAQLLEAGVREDHIEVANLCTACRTDLFYSHRAEQGVTGRLGGMIVLRSGQG